MESGFEVGIWREVWVGGRIEMVKVDGKERMWRKFCLKCSETRSNSKRGRWVEEYRVGVKGEREGSIVYRVWIG